MQGHTTKFKIHELSGDNVLWEVFENEWKRKPDQVVKFPGDDGETHELHNWTGKAPDGRSVTFSAEADVDTVICYTYAELTEEEWKAAYVNGHPFEDDETAH